METQKRLAEVLNDLVKINHDRTAGYEKAANQANDADLKALFSKYAGDSRKYANDLSAAAGGLGKDTADEMKTKYDSVYPKNMIQLYFTSNHDENSWNKSDYGTFPGAVHAPFAVYTQTMYGSMPLIYSGQEEPVLRKIEFFEKDTFGFKEYKRAKFYKTLLALRKRNAALSTDASFKKINAGDNNAVYAYIRSKAGKKVLVVLNLSDSEQTIAIQDKTLWGTPLNVFMGTKEKLTGNSWKMEPWGYAVYEY